VQTMSFGIRCQRGQRSSAVHQPSRAAARRRNREPGVAPSALTGVRLARALRAVAVLRAQVSEDTEAIAAAAGPDVLAALGMRMLADFARCADDEAMAAYLVEAQRLHQVTRDLYLGMNDAALAVVRLVADTEASRTDELLSALDDVLRSTIGQDVRPGMPDAAPRPQAPTAAAPRVQVALRVVDPPRIGGRTVLVVRSPGTPAVVGDGDLDVICGRCAQVVGRGIACPADIRGVVFQCGRCGNYSELPTS